MKKIWALFMVMAVVLCMISGMVMPVMAEEPESTGMLDEGDFSYIEHTQTKRTDETNCQVTVVTDCPEGFGLNTYVVISDSDGMMYRISLSEENGYRDRIFLPSGNYSVVEAGVFEDHTGRYPFEQKKGDRTFQIEDGETVELGFRLVDYDKIAGHIAGAKKGEAGETIPVMEDRYATAMDGVEINGVGEMFYPVEAFGSGIGELVISGNAKGNYDVVVEVIQPGVIGEARFSLSLDGGETIIGDDVTAEKFPLKEYGMTLFFSTASDTDELKEGDVFRASVPETFAVDTARYGEANVVAAGHPAGEHLVEVTILSSGGRGEAKFTVSMDGGNSISYTDTIPEDGHYSLGDGLELLFSDSGQFEKGQVFAAEVKPNGKTVSMVPVYVLLGTAGAVTLAGYGFLLSKKERQGDYVLHVWKDLQEKEVYR